MRLEDVPGIRGRKAVHAFVRDHLSMLFEDIRGIIVQRGYNFACANLLCDFLSGLSVTIYKPAVTNIKAGQAFKALVDSPFFPWETTDTGKDKKLKTEVLYKFIRNPLTHALGVDEKPGLYFAIGKKPKPLSKRELARMEKSPTRPGSIKPPISGSGGKWLLCIEGLHHAAFRLFWNLARDKAQMDAAEMRFVAGKLAWLKF